MIADSMKKMGANDVDGALNDLSQAVKLNPNSTGAYVLRASIYCQKKQWTQAEDDFKAAAQIAPTNSVLKFNLVEVKFMQKQYDAARPGYVELQKDPDMGDFASYKVFLCDLFGGHEAAAKKELDVFNDVVGNPSYYFSNAAWSLVHKNLEDARSWLLSASRIYPPRKNAYYAQSLRDLGYHADSRAQRQSHASPREGQIIGCAAACSSATSARRHQNHRAVHSATLNYLEGNASGCQRQCPRKFTSAS